MYPSLQQEVKKIMKRSKQHTSGKLLVKISVRKCKEKCKMKKAKTSILAFVDNPKISRGQQRDQEVCSTQIKTISESDI